VITNESSAHPNEQRDFPTNSPELGEILPAPPADPKLPWWKAWIEVLVAGAVWFTSVLFLLFVPLIVIVPYIAYVWFTSGPPNPETLATGKPILLVSILGVVPAHVATFALIWLVTTHAGRYPFAKTIGFEWPKSLGAVKGILLSALISVALLGVGGLVTYYYGDQKTDLDLLIESSVQARWATAFIAFATAPLIEELLYRGVMYSALEKAFVSVMEKTAGTGLAITIITILFAGVHVYQYRNNIAVISVITVLSLTLTVVRAISGKVLPCFVIHLVFNGIQSLILVTHAFETSDKVTPTTPGFSLLAQFVRSLA
jgi:uncharacterized protein